MARIRSIKPGFFENEDLGQLPPLARLLFAGLWCWADREGRLEDRPSRIKAQILPYDQCDCSNLLERLASKGFITRYSVDGRKCIAVNEFLKHQFPHHREADSTIPPPGEKSSSPRQALGKPEAEPCLALDEPELGTAQPGGSLGSGSLGSCSWDPVLGNGSLDLEAAPLVVRDDACGGLASLIRRWNKIQGVRSCRIDNPKRKAAYNARRRETGWLANVDAALAKVAESGFCQGTGKQNWVADLDWFLRPGTVANLIEGKYDDRDGPVMNDRERQNLTALERWAGGSNGND